MATTKTTFTASTLTARDLIAFVTDAYAVDTDELIAEFGESEANITAAAARAGLISTAQDGESFWQSPYGEDADEHIAAFGTDVDAPILALVGSGDAPKVAPEVINAFMDGLAPTGETGTAPAPVVSVPAEVTGPSKASAEEQREAAEFLRQRSRKHYCRNSYIAKDVIAKVIREDARWNAGTQWTVREFHNAWKEERRSYAMGYGTMRKFLHAMAISGIVIERRGGGRGRQWKYCYSRALDHEPVTA
jgi:hypothetical protein